MKASLKIRHEEGITILEFALWITVLMSLVIVGFNVVEHIQRQRFTEFLLEDSIRDTAVKPFKYVNGTIDLNRETLTDYVKATTDGLSKNIIKKFGKSTDYYVEVAYAEVDIDKNSGMAGIPHIEYQVEKTAGNQGEFLKAKRETDLSSHLNNYVHEATNSGASSFIYASPIFGSTSSSLSAASGITQSTDKYMPKAVMVLGRIIVSNTTGTPAEYVKKKVGLDPVYYFVKVTTLRGDFNL